MFAKCAMAANDSGVSLEDYLDSVKTVDKKPSIRTLYRHVAAIRQNKSPFTAKKKTGHVSALTKEQKRILGGFLLMNEKATDLKSVQRFCNKAFTVLLSLATCSRYLTELELSIQLVGKRTFKQGLSYEQYCKEYYQYLVDTHKSGFFSIDDADLGSVDFITNSHRLDRQTTIHGIGMNQKKIQGQKVYYTDSIINMIWMSGDNWTPGILFSHNPTFDDKGKRKDDVLKWCKELKIDRDPIVYTKPEKQYSKYCKEDKSQVSHFAHIYSETLKGMHILRDGGNAFKNDKVDILGEYASRISVMPSEQHGELSPNDNNYNAIIKTKWRNRLEDDQDEAYQSLILLQETDLVKPQAIMNMFINNLFLRDKKLSLKNVVTSLKNKKTKSIKRFDLFKSYETSFKRWRKSNPGYDENFGAIIPEGKLDGKYWKIN
jgi:hypothetical protein